MSNILGTRLKELRIKNNKLQKDVADYLNISYVAYGYYEKGERQPNPDMLSKLADYFDVTADYLIGRTNEPKYTVISPITETKSNIDLSDISEKDKETVIRVIEMAKSNNKK